MEMELLFGRLLIENLYDKSHEPNGFIVYVPDRKNTAKTHCKNLEELIEVIKNSCVDLAEVSRPERLIPNS